MLTAVSMDGKVLDYTVLEANETPASVTEVLNLRLKISSKARNWKTWKSLKTMA